MIKTEINTYHVNEETITAAQDDLEDESDENERVAERLCRF